MTKNEILEELLKVLGDLPNKEIYRYSEDFDPNYSTLDDCYEAGMLDGEILLAKKIYEVLLR